MVLTVYLSCAWKWGTAVCRTFKLYVYVSYFEIRLQETVFVSSMNSEIYCLPSSQNFSLILLAYVFPS